MTLNITYRKPGDLIHRSGNPRTHTDKQIDKIARSIERFGFTNPVLVDRDGGVIAGHGRSEAEVRAYVIADNRLADEAGWDRALLTVEFAYLDELDLDFDLTLTGFELSEIDLVLQEAGQEDGPDPADEVPEPAEGPATTRSGDIWQIGPHREGDALALEEPDASYDAVICNFGVFHFTEPPLTFGEAYRVLRPGGRYAFSQWASPKDSPLFSCVFGAIMKSCRHEQSPSITGCVYILRKRKMP